MDAPVSTPGNPFGAKGCQFAELMACAAPRQNRAMAATLITTMVVFAPALSRTPRTSSHVTAMVMTSAGTLNHPAGPPAAGNGGNASCGGKCHPSTLWQRSCRYAEKPTATDMLDTAYSR